MIRPLSIWLCAGLLAAFGIAALAQDIADDIKADARAQLTGIRFVTADDFPPFNAYDEEGILTGFNVDLARLICQDLSIADNRCSIDALPWDELLQALKARTADAVIAAHRVTSTLAREFSFSKRYFYTPARFAVRRNAASFATTPAGLDGRSVAVVRGSAHEAYLSAFFRNTDIKPFDTAELAREAVETGRVDAVFDDGIGLVFWANGTASKACCVLRGGPYFEPRYFGDGMAIIVRKDDRLLQTALNEAIQRLQANGRFREIVGKSFPIKVY